MNKLIHCNNPEAIKKTCQVLQKGGIIIYPTDTIYGLGCDAKNETAIKKINKIKNRIGPMSVIAPNKKTALAWMKVNKNMILEIKHKIKNGNTVIVPIKKGVCSNIITGDNHSLGIRIPEHSFCKNLTKRYPNPITTTSVNQTGQQPFTNPTNIFNYFSKMVDLIIEDGIIVGNGSKIFLLKNKIWEQLR